MSNFTNRMSTARKEWVAEILAEVYACGNSLEVARKFQVSDRSIRNYKKRLETDPELAELFKAKKARIVEGWEAEVPGAMRESVAFIRRAAEEGDPKDPNMLHAVAGALKLVSGVASSWKFLEAKLARLDTHERKQPTKLKAVSGGRG